MTLGHGAGGGVDAADLQALAVALVGVGCGVVLVEQPWRLAGRRVAPRPQVLDEGWLDALRSLRPRGPLIVGGRSAGARVACRTAGELNATAVLCLAFPLHPPGRPERSRRDELVACPVPVAALQGDRDPFGSAAELRRAARGATVLTVPRGDHSLATLPPAVIDRALRWVADIGTAASGPRE